MSLAVRACTTVYVQSITKPETSKAGIYRKQKYMQFLNVRTEKPAAKSQTKNCSSSHLCRETHGGVTSSALNQEDIEPIGENTYWFCFIFMVRRLVCDKCPQPDLKPGSWGLYSM